MDPFREATRRADVTRRVQGALELAGFSACAPGALELSSGLRRALDDLLPRDLPLPRRLSVPLGAAAAAPGRAPDLLALVLHDGRSGALEAELPAIVAGAVSGPGAASLVTGALALGLRSLEPARALLAAHGLDPATIERLLEDPRALELRGEPADTGASDAVTPDAGGEDPAKLERVLLGLLGRLRFRTYGTRTPEEVAARLAGRLSRTLPQVARKVQGARAGLLELSALEGTPAECLARAEAVLARAGVARSALDSLREHLADLSRLGVGALRLDLAPGRRDEPGPLDALLDPAWSLEAPGPGRVARGGSFAFRGGRASVAAIHLGALAPHASSEIAAGAQVLVVPVSKNELAPAHALALEARTAGLRAELDPSGRNLRSSLRAASHRDIPLVAILGEREVADGVVLVKDLAREQQTSVPRRSVVGELSRLLALGAGPSAAAPAHALGGGSPAVGPAAGPEAAPHPGPRTLAGEAP